MIMNPSALTLLRICGYLRQYDYSTKQVGICRGMILECACLSKGIGEFRARTDRAAIKKPRRIRCHTFWHAVIISPGDSFNLIDLQYIWLSARAGYRH